MPNISWLSIVLGVTPFLLLLILKFLLDLRLAQLAVKYLYWLPVRNYFREKPVGLSGTWEQIWNSGGSAAYSKKVDRHGHPKIHQLGSYIYAEFYSQRILYAFFGQVKGRYIVGDWYDVKDESGYFGVFQLEIVSSKELLGVWVGHSKKNRIIRSDSVTWKRIDS